MDLTERGDASTRHPWEVQRFRAYLRVLDRHGALDARRVVDVGAGDGWFAEQLRGALAHDATVVCWDANYGDDELSSPVPGIVRTRERPRDAFDLVLVLDVLEHIEDAESFVRDELRDLAPGGTPVLVAVPAHQRLFGAHDVALGHHRRYSRRGLRELVSAWIDPVDEGGLFSSLLLPRAVQVGLERRRPRGPDPADDTAHGIGTWSGGRVTTALVGAALAGDVAVAGALARVGVRLPGLSLWTFGTVR